MDVVISIKTVGFQKLMTRLSGMDERSQSLKRPLTRAIPLMLRSIHRNFVAEGRPSAWAPLALSTIMQKKRMGFSSKILTRSGFLRRSIVGQADDKSLTIGTNVFYGKFHQFGTSRMPMRRFLIFQTEDLDNIKDLILQHIKRET